jgi:uncharacterized delta-60 repeat protein
LTHFGSLVNTVHGNGSCHRWFAILATVIALTACPTARGAAGDLDPGFAADGRVAFPAAGAFVARAVAIDGAGRIVVAGYACEPDPVSSDGTCLADGNSSFRLARLTPDGGLDPEFGANGFVTTPVGTGRSQALDLQLLPDGAIIAGGVATVGGSDVFALVRYTADGAVDPGFGDNGVVLQPIGEDYAAVADVTAGPGSTIIAAGQAVDAGGQPRMAVARFTAAGALDASFGGNGFTLGGASPYGYGLSVATWADGSVLSGGIAGDTAAASTYRFGELRLTPSGLPDGSFGAGGAAQQRIGSSSSFANAIVPLPGGAWMAAGAATVPDGRQAMAITRGTASGTLDASFAGTGSALVPLFEGGVANDLALYPDGRAVAIGQAAQGGTYVFAQARLLPSGRLDPAFGAAGVGAIAWDRYPVARATAGALQADGRLVSVGIGCSDGGTGTRCTGGKSVLLVSRQLGDPPSVEPTPTPTPTPVRDRTAPTIKVAAPAKRIGHRKLRRKGIKLTVRLSELGRLRVTLAGRRPGRRKRVTLRRIARRDPRAAFTLRVKGRARRGTVRLTIRATDAAGNTRTKHFTIRVR